MGLSSGQLESKAEKIRQRLSARLRRLESRVSPATILSDLFGLPAAHPTDDAWPMLVQQVRKNPIAFVLMAAGVASLILTEPGRLQSRSHARRRKNTRNLVTTRGSK